MIYDAIVVGGGIAGLTSTAFLAKAGRSVLLLEKGNQTGGLVNTFERDGFLYDGGIRALEDSGVLFPMLKKLGLEIDFVPNRITIGIEDRVMRVDDKRAVEDYQSLLEDLYPESRTEIADIMADIRRIMHYMDVQYSIINPAFLDVKEDRDYFIKKILPWMVQYAFTAPRISRLQEPVVAHLRRFTQNQALLDIITQHFFQETPAFFALSYLKLYLDYHYPLGGTSRVVERMTHYIREHGGEIRTNTGVVAVDPQKQTVTDASHAIHAYRRLIWTADQKTLYRCLDESSLPDAKAKGSIAERRAAIADKTGNDSVFTLFLGLDLPPTYFSDIASEHFFYTPSRAGQSQAGPIPYGKDRRAIESWLKQFTALTTYEITCPVLRDPALAPAGKTGLIVSLLFDYRLTKQVEQMGWYEDFKTLMEESILETLDASIYPGLQAGILHRFSSTPLTMEHHASNTDGAITGWAFTNHPIPAESRIPRILNAVRTPIPGVFQAGQWTYSPSGLPISIITGKLACDQVLKEL